MVVLLVHREEVYWPMSCLWSLSITLSITRYEAPGDLRVEYVKRKWLTSGEWSCLLDNGPKLAMGQPNSSFEKEWKNQKMIAYTIKLYHQLPSVIFFIITSLWHMSRAIAHACLCTRLKQYRRAKKSRLV